MDELISICTFCILAFLSAVNKSKDSLKHLCFMLIYAEIQQHFSLEWQQVVTLYVKLF